MLKFWFTNIGNQDFLLSEISAGTDELSITLFTDYVYAHFSQKA